jgi:hypothetical protein
MIYHYVHGTFCGNENRKFVTGYSLYTRIISAVGRVESVSGRKETTRKTRSKWEDNIKVDTRKIGWSDMDRICLAEDRTSGGLL